MTTHPLSEQIRVQYLNDKENLESVLLRIQKGWTLHFKLGPTLFGRKIKFFSNYPVQSGASFNREKYYELNWKSESTNKEDDTSLFCPLTYTVAGSFHYFFIDSDSVLDKSGSGYILVEPTLKYGRNNDILPLNSLVCQTYLAKCLGPFPEWEARLRVAKETAYNMVHITPIQELGASLSCYSLRNQLKLNPMFNTPDSTYTIDDVARLVDKMKREWNVLSITDIVLNHTANESDWLLDHPEATYNLQNSPHLKPAYLLDRTLWYLALEASEGKWEPQGLPAIISKEDHLQAIKSIMYARLLCIKIHELYMVNVETLVKEFKENLLKLGSSSTPQGENKPLVIIQDPNYGRLASKVDMNLAIRRYGQNCKPGDMGQVNSCCEAFKKKMEELNQNIKGEVSHHIDSAMDNVIKAIRYERLDPYGPKYKKLSDKCPLVAPYFYQAKRGTSLADDEKLMYSEDAKYVMAHNGWVMGDDPLRNFAEPGSNVYIRRELIAWGDSVKLRYGEVPKDSPYLWEHMTKYVQQMAKAFHGLRLDNCHSTPIHVAEYLIDKAREMRPDLYIIAELFTSSEAVDNIFVNRLGITSLIREAMSAPDAHEEGRLVYRYGGECVGAFVHPHVRPLTPNIAHAMFLDLTHDNQCPIQTRSAYDLFPSAALVSMACCATGSTRGYDELVPHQINVVTESRKYLSWTDSQGTPPGGYVNLNSGIIAGKRALNKLHQELGSAGYSQVYVNQKGAHTVAVTRHCPATHQSVVMVVCTAFSSALNPMEKVFLDAEIIPGNIEEIIFEGKLVPASGKSSYAKSDEEYEEEGEGEEGEEVKEVEKFINGLNEYELKLRENIQLHDSDMVKMSQKVQEKEALDFVHFSYGYVIAFRVSLPAIARTAILKIRNSISQFGYSMRKFSLDKSAAKSQQPTKNFESIISDLSLSDLNKVLFRCEAEERDEIDGGAYVIPNYGPLLYCGLQGIMSELSTIHLRDDLGHPFCDNLRKGMWLPGYVASRLLKDDATHALGEWFRDVFKYLQKVPDYLVPLYFDSIISGAYSSLLSATFRKMSDFINEGSEFVKHLALGSVILCGVVSSAPLPDLSPAIQEPLPPMAKGADKKLKQACATISAGLPHFSTGYMRNWGRDTFISLRGLLLIPGRYDEARYIILAFAGCLRHGLIPNLLDKGVNARYNCRDAIWWWLQSIQDYVRIVDNGYTILQDKVSRLFPTDGSTAQPPGQHDEPLYDTIQQSLQKHFQGLKFRERNAGIKIDEHMNDEGFNNEIGVDLQTGFVFGGNVHNCGTWMDKMGSSTKAGNRGIPATPRDGSAVELVGLLASTLRWLNKMYETKHYPYNKVERTIVKDGKQSKMTMTFKEWQDLIRANFEKCFWVPVETSPDDSKHINRRGIYKDSYGATDPWTDYQLRPNICITMVVAPELFTLDKAWTALTMIEKILLGPLGMKTLDPSDWQYNGNYDNSDDSTEKNKARGFNYHQGPEWLWPIGFFLRAKLYFALALGPEKLKATLSFVRHVLSRHFIEIQANKWRGLPELTNADGAHCKDSCSIQAWSHACLLEVLYDIDQIIIPSAKARS